MKKLDDLVSKQEERRYQRWLGRMSALLDEEIVECQGRRQPLKAEDEVLVQAHEQALTRLMTRRFPGWSTFPRAVWTLFVGEEQERLLAGQAVLRQQKRLPLPFRRLLLETLDARQQDEAPGLAKPGVSGDSKSLFFLGKGGGSSITPSVPRSLVQVDLLLAFTRSELCSQAPLVKKRSLLFKEVMAFFQGVSAYLKPEKEPFPMWWQAVGWIEQAIVRDLSLLAEGLEQPSVKEAWVQSLLDRVRAGLLLAALWAKKAQGEFQELASGQQEKAEVSGLDALNRFLSLEGRARRLSSEDRQKAYQAFVSAQGERVGRGLLALLKDLEERHLEELTWLPLVPLRQLLDEERIGQVGGGEKDQESSSFF